MIPQDLANKLLQALTDAGFPGNLNGQFNAAVVARLNSYWTAHGWTLPATLDNANKLFLAFAGADATSIFTAAEASALASAYMSMQGGWLKKNWMWLVGGVVLLGGAVAGGIYWWKKTHQPPMGKLGDGGLGGDDGLGCPCALGHGGRTAMYEFPSGKKRGHYRDSTGRFHAHP